MKTVQLKNGAEEAASLVNIAMNSITTLLKSKPIVVYELVMKCRDSNHELFGKSGEDLRELSLIEADGSVHSSIRNIVLSAASGDGLDMVFSSPIAPVTETMDK